MSIFVILLYSNYSNVPLSCSNSPFLKEPQKQRLNYKERYNNIYTGNWTEGVPNTQYSCHMPDALYTAQCSCEICQMHYQLPPMH